MIIDCQDYEKTLFSIATQKISIDLDDGVKMNYQKCKGCAGTGKVIVGFAC